MAARARGVHFRARSAHMCRSLAHPATQQRHHQASGLACALSVPLHWCTCTPSSRAAPRRPRRTRLAYLPSSRACSHACPDLDLPLLLKLLRPTNQRVRWQRLVSMLARIRWVGLRGGGTGQGVRSGSRQRTGPASSSHALCRGWGAPGASGHACTQHAPPTPRTSPRTHLLQGFQLHGLIKRSQLPACSSSTGAEQLGHLLVLVKQGPTPCPTTPAPPRPAAATAHSPHAPLDGGVQVPLGDVRRREQPRPRGHGERAEVPDEPHRGCCGLVREPQELWPRARPQARECPPVARGGTPKWRTSTTCRAPRGQGAACSSSSTSSTSTSRRARPSCCASTRWSARAARPPSCSRACWTWPPRPAAPRAACWEPRWGRAGAAGGAHSCCGCSRRPAPINCHG